MTSTYAGGTSALLPVMSQQNLSPSRGDTAELLTLTVNETATSGWTCLKPRLLTPPDALLVTVVILLGLPSGKVIPAPSRPLGSQMIL